MSTVRARLARIGRMGESCSAMELAMLLFAQSFSKVLNRMMRGALTRVAMPMSHR